MVWNRWSLSSSTGRRSPVGFIGITVGKHAPRLDIRPLCQCVTPLFGGAKLEAGHAGCNVQAALRLETERLQGKALAGPSDQKIGIRFMSDTADDPRRWYFTKSSPSASHRLAIADGSGAAGSLPIVVRPWPLARSASVA